MQFGVSESVLHWAKYKPDKIAIFTGNKEITYEEYNDLVNCYCNSLFELIPGDEIRIGLALKNKLNFLVSLASVLRLCKSSVILNISLNENALNTNITDTNVKYILHDNDMIREKLPKQNAIYIDVRNFVDTQNASTVHFDIGFERKPDEEWGVLFSSGTTGTPKGIERDQYSMITEHVGWCLELGLNRNTKFYIGRPLFYTGGLVLTMATFLVGGSVIVNDYIDGNNFNEVWQDYQNILTKLNIDWAFFTPEVLRTFIENSKLKGKPLRSATNILSMGSMITQEEKIAVKKLLYSNIVESWGNSESLGTITDPEDLELHPDSIGRPFITDELYIVDDDGKILGPNKFGRIAGAKEAGFSGYSNRLIDTEKILKDELIISEDIGFMSNDNYFYIKGRMQDLVTINGKSLFLPELEAHIRDKLSVSKICVLSTGSENNPKLYALTSKKYLKDIVEKDELLKKINEQLEDYQKLEKGFIIEELPLTASGKIDKTAAMEILKKMLN